MHLYLWHSMLHKPEGLCSVQSCWTMTAVSQACLKSRMGLDCPVLRGLCPHCIAQQFKQPSFCVLNHPHLTWWTDRLISVCVRDPSLVVAAMWSAVKLLLFTLNLQKPWVTVARLLTSLNGLVNLSAVPTLRGICEVYVKVMRWGQSVMRWSSKHNNVSVLSITATLSRQLTRWASSIHNRASSQLGMCWPMEQTFGRIAVFKSNEQNWMQRSR